MGDCGVGGGGSGRLWEKVSTVVWGGGVGVWEVCVWHVATHAWGVSNPAWATLPGAVAMQGLLVMTQDHRACAGRSERRPSLPPSTLNPRPQNQACEPAPPYLGSRTRHGRRVCLSRRSRCTAAACGTSRTAPLALRPWAAGAGCCELWHTARWRLPGCCRRCLQQPTQGRGWVRRVQQAAAVDSKLGGGF